MKKELYKVCSGKYPITEGKRFPVSKINIIFFKFLNVFSEMNISVKNGIIPNDRNYKVSSI